MSLQYEVFIFHLSARVGESLANSSLSIQASRQVLKIMISPILFAINQQFKQGNDLYLQKRCFMEVFMKCREQVLTFLQ